MVLWEALQYNEQQATAEDRYVDKLYVINWLIQKNQYTHYLEIGCRRNDCFARVACRFKVGVDPMSGGTLRMTSDRYFAEHKGETFDIILIDGLHEHEQVYRDIQNSLLFLREGGVIVLHDCYPLTLESAMYPCPKQVKFWNGDGYKALWRIRERLDVDATVLNVDWGVGFIQKKRNTALLTEAQRYVPDRPEAEQFRMYQHLKLRVARLSPWKQVQVWLPQKYPQFPVALPSTQVWMPATQTLTNDPL